jgi:hypothetical protein
VAILSRTSLRSFSNKISSSSDAFALFSAAMIFPLARAKIAAAFFRVSILLLRVLRRVCHVQRASYIGVEVCD